MTEDVGTDDLLLLSVRGIDELLTHENAHHILTILGGLVSHILLRSGDRHRHATIRSRVLGLRHWHLGLTTMLVMMVHLLTWLPLLLAWQLLLLLSIHLRSTSTHSHLLLINSLIIVLEVLGVVLLLTIVRAVGHSCPALVTTVEAVPVLLGYTAVLTTVHTAIASSLILELAHKQAETRDQLYDVLVARLQLTCLHFVELLAVILFLLALLTLLLWLTKVD